MPTRHKVSELADFPDNESRVIVDIDGQEIAVVRVDGQYYALLNFCVHQGGPLCEGTLTGRTTVGEDGWEWEYDDTEKNVRCPWHGWMFDVTTGTCVDAKRYSIPTYEVEVEDGDIYVIV